jgi:hypothetical protein
MKKVFLLAGVVFLLGFSAAAADCERGGRTYPEGTRVGDFICEDGRWVYRP